MCTFQNMFTLKYLYQGNNIWSETLQRFELIGLIAIILELTYIISELFAKEVVCRQFNYFKRFISV